MDRVSPQQEMKMTQQDLRYPIGPFEMPESVGEPELRLFPGSDQTHSGGGVISGLGVPPASGLSVSRRRWTTRRCMS